MELRNRKIIDPDRPSRVVRSRAKARKEVSEDIINYLSFKLSGKHLIIIPELLQKWENLENEKGIIFINNLIF